MRQVDLGCGTRRSIHEGVDEYIGVDIKEGGVATVACDIGFAPLPFEDSSVDLVTAYDLLEHIPFFIRYYTAEGMKDAKEERAGEGFLVAPPMGSFGTYSPMVFLFNEIYRILKDGGIFFSSTPFYPNRGIFQDPTHVSVWTEETISYFCGDYYGKHYDFGHTSRFVKQAAYDDNNGHIIATLEARKDVPDTVNFHLSYPRPYDAT